MKKEDFGINGAHTLLGQQINSAEFRGATTQKLGSIEKSIEELKQEIKEDHALLWREVKHNTRFRWKVKGIGIFLGTIGIIVGILGVIAKLSG